ncbi:MAG: type II secretion system protein [Pseudomonadota bacterium]
MFKLIKRKNEYSKLHGFSGFTIVEMVLAIAVVGILAGLLGPVISSGVRQYALAVRQKAALAQARLAMERMGAEILLIPATASIDTWTASVVQFDLPTENNINYSLNGTNLERSGVVLASGISSLAFTYLNQDGNTAGSQADIRRIGFELVVGAGTGYGAVRVRNQIFPRPFSSAYAGFQ